MDYESVFGEIAKAKMMIEEERSEYFRRWCISMLAMMHNAFESIVSAMEAGANDPGLSIEERLSLVARLSDEFKELSAWAAVSVQTQSQIGQTANEKEIPEKSKEKSSGHRLSKVPFIPPPRGSKVN